MGIINSIISLEITLGLGVRLVDISFQAGAETSVRFKVYDSRVRVEPRVRVDSRVSVEPRVRVSVLVTIIFKYLA